MLSPSGLFASASMNTHISKNVKNVELLNLMGSHNPATVWVPLDRRYLNNFEVAAIVLASNILFKITFTEKPVISVVVFQCTDRNPEAQEGSLNAGWLFSDPGAPLGQTELHIFTCSSQMPLPSKTCVSLPSPLPLPSPVFLQCLTLLLSPQLCDYFSLPISVSALGWFLCFYGLLSVIAPMAREGLWV